MRKIIVILLLGFILIPVKSYTEYWGELEIKKSLIERLSFEVNSRVRFKSGISELYRYRTEVGSIFQIDKFKGVGLYFESEEGWERGKKLQGTSSLSLYMRLSYASSAFRLMDGNRIDCQDLELWRYRNLLKIIGPTYVIYEKSIYYGQVPTICRLSPSLEEELFFNINEIKVDENRLLLGIYFEVVPYMSFKLGYMLYSEREKEWKNKGVIVTTLEFTFLGTE